jgi:hypothetical protein
MATDGMDGMGGMDRMDGMDGMDGRTDDEGRTKGLMVKEGR